MGKCSEVCNVCLVTSDKNHFYEVNGDVGKGIESQLFTEFGSIVGLCLMVLCQSVQGLTKYHIKATETEVHKLLVSRALYLPGLLNRKAFLELNVTVCMKIWHMQ